MIYCDTSLLVSALTEETDSDRAADWLASVSGRSLAISSWTFTEFASAIAAKVRANLLSSEGRSVIETRWQALSASVQLLPIEPRHFTRSTLLVDAGPRGLRAGDALHLAVAIEHGCELATFDHDLADAARELGVAVHP